MLAHIGRVGLGILVEMEMGTPVAVRMLINRIDPFKIRSELEVQRT